jgi:uncharacterized membrane protein YcaP (DUF421 family)
MNLPYPWLLASIAARTFIVLVAVTVGMRMYGKRGVGELNTTDLVMILLIGNAVQNALTYGSGDLGIGLVSAGTLLALDWVMGGLVVRRPWLERRLTGEPTILCRDGQLDHRAMHRASVSEPEIYAAIREEGLVDISRVRLIVLEPDGQLSVIADD